MDDERTEFDVIVIGAGPAGENAAAGTAAAGFRTALVEAELVGGECSYWACIPSKALLRPIEALDAVRHVAGASAAATGELSVAEVLGRRDERIGNYDDSGQAHWAQDAGIQLFRGHGRLVGERVVEVSGEITRTLTARQAVVIATGSAPLAPPVPGLTEVAPWGSREATGVREVPESLVILGGGVVGVEMAQVFVGLGARVTLVARTGLLPRAEPFAGELVQDSLAAQGVTVRTGVEPTSVERSADGTVTLNLDDSSTVQAAQILVATGRRPRTADVGLDRVGLDPQELHVDDRGGVRGVEGHWLYAVGDACGRAPLTHQGKHQGRIVAAVIIARARGSLPSTTGRYTPYDLAADREGVPQVVFTDPQVAWVGQTALTAEQQGIAHRVVDLAIDVAGAGLHRDGYTGQARFVIDQEREVLLGVTFVGAGVAELLHAATIAVVGEVPLSRLWHAVPAFPTISEVWLRFLEADRSRR